MSDRTVCVWLDSPGGDDEVIRDFKLVIRARLSHSEGEAWLAQGCEG